MIGPVVQTDAAVARGLGSAIGMLPPQVKLALLVLALLVGMVACSAAWADYKQYVPSPNVCRADQVARAAQLGCVVPQQVPAGWQR
ncbi:hypothetical protein ACFVMC_33015 [Nocardia sp. NPDC127579]|uniref:hypothetical protein n=1 Tax=Nocardia sp. NPDC127579 TaxID=3345402 RepID=UPI0036356431